MNPTIDPPRQRGPQPRLRLWRKATGRWLGTRLGAQAVRGLSMLCRKTELGAQNRRAAEEEHGGIILALWHGRGVLAAPFYDAEQATVLVSASDDGRMATRILEDLGYRIVRGSSSRRGVRAVREMIATLAAGKHIVITPDGPRGPMHSIGPGVAFLSRVSGRPVLPVGFACDRAWHLGTWDRYTIPKPRAHVVACYRPPVVVHAAATTAEIVELSRTIRDGLRQAEREAFAHLSLAPDWGEVPEWAPDWA